MRSNPIPILLWLSGISSVYCSPAQNGFLPPDDDSFTRNGQIDQFPLSFNISDSQHKTDVQIDGSFWVNSFIHASNGHDYYIASHIANYVGVLPGFVPVYRASILDVTDPSYYHNYLRTAPENASLWTEEGDFRASFDGYTLESASKDPLHGIHMFSSLEGIHFDLTFNFTSPVLLNAALGSFWVAGGLGWQWSLPRAATEGWLMVGGEKVDVVTEKSFTWYDRQWGSFQGSFDWVMVHFEESDWLDISVMSVWDWTDVVNGPKEFATIRNVKTGHDSTVPLSVTPSTTNVWVSPKTGNVYPQEWLLVLDDIEIIVKSPRPDQVIEPPPGVVFPAQFSGYVDMVATKAGHPPVKGFGTVERLIFE